MEASNSVIATCKLSQTPTPSGPPTNDTIPIPAQKDKVTIQTYSRDPRPTPGQVDILGTDTAEIGLLVTRQPFQSRHVLRLSPQSAQVTRLARRAHQHDVAHNVNDDVDCSCRCANSDRGTQTKHGRALHLAGKEGGAFHLWMKKRWPLWRGRRGPAANDSKSVMKGARMMQNVTGTSHQHAAAPRRARNAPFLHHFRITMQNRRAKHTRAVWHRCAEHPRKQGICSTKQRERQEGDWVRAKEPMFQSG